eukprot:jgi/Chrzof1/8236/Cz03g02160.t1
MEHVAPWHTHCLPRPSRASWHIPHHPRHVRPAANRHNDPLIAPIQQQQQQQQQQIHLAQPDGQRPLSAQHDNSRSPAHALPFIREYQEASNPAVAALHEQSSEAPDGAKKAANKPHHARRHQQSKSKAAGRQSSVHSSERPDLKYAPSGLVPLQNSGHPHLLAVYNVAPLQQQAVVGSSKPATTVAESAAVAKPQRPHYNPAWKVNRHSSQKRVQTVNMFSGISSSANRSKQKLGVAGRKQQQQHSGHVEETTNADINSSTASTATGSVSPATAMPGNPEPVTAATAGVRPVAPEDPEQLLQVLQSMPPPLRRVVIFKGGGYIYSAMEDMIADNRLGHVMRLTNLIRKAHCVLCKPTWDDGRKIHLREHQVAAEKRGVPFLLIDSLSAVAVVEQSVRQRSVVWY